MPASAAAILTAAGSGSRLGLGYPKALATLAACPLVGHAARRLCATGEIARLVVTAPADQVADFEAALRATDGISVPWQVVAGGPSRQASVAAGLAALSDSGAAQAQAEGRAPYDVVLVHDAARPLAPTSMMLRIIAAVRAGAGAVVPALAVTDTIKTVVPAGAGATTCTQGALALERVAGTADRTVLRAVQTPQGFSWDVLTRAHAAGAARAADETTAATDDSALVEALGEPVWLVEGDPSALKITTTHDLSVAQVLVAASEADTAPSPGIAHPEHKDT